MPKVDWWFQNLNPDAYVTREQLYKIQKNYTIYSERIYQFFVWRVKPI